MPCVRFIAKGPIARKSRGNPCVSIAAYTWVNRGAAEIRVTILNHVSFERKLLRRGKLNRKRRRQFVTVSELIFDVVIVFPNRRHDARSHFAIGIEHAVDVEINAIAEVFGHLEIYRRSIFSKGRLCDRIHDTAWTSTWHQNGIWSFDDLDAFDVIRRQRHTVAIRTREIDRKSTRLNSSHQIISYAVFCLKKKTHR